MCTHSVGSFIKLGRDGAAPLHHRPLPGPSRVLFAWACVSLPSVTVLFVVVFSLYLTDVLIDLGEKIIASVLELSWYCSVVFTELLSTLGSSKLHVLLPLGKETDACLVVHCGFASSSLGS